MKSDRQPRVVISCENLTGYEGYRDLALKNCYKDLSLCGRDSMRTFTVREGFISKNYHSLYLFQKKKVSLGRREET